MKFSTIFNGSNPGPIFASNQSTNALHDALAPSATLDSRSDSKVPLYCRPEFILFFLITLSFLIVDPIGEYAIDDDWIFVKSLLYLHKDGHLKILDWNPMSLLSHLWWGALFTKFFGFSFTVSKISVVVMLFIECLTFIALLRRLGLSQGMILMSVLAVVFNPLHFFQSFQYATDIPSVSLELLALLFYLKALERAGKDQTFLLILASAFGALSFLVRQHGILIHVAFFLYLLLWDKAKFKSIRFLFASFACPLLTVIAFTYWYNYVHGQTEAFIKTKKLVWDWVMLSSPGLMIAVAFFVLIYIGFFLAPLTLAVPFRTLKTNLGKGMSLFASIALFTTVLFLKITLGDRILFPYIPNKITRFGFFIPNQFVLGDREVLWGRGVSWGVSVLFFLSSLLFLFFLCQAFDRAAFNSNHRSEKRLVLLLLLLQLTYVLLTSPVIFDRHLLLLFPTAVLLFVAVLGKQRELSKVRFTLLTIPMAFYGLAGTHDIHAISRTTFIAGESLIARGIDPLLIDGGLAFDGWYSYERSKQEGISRWRVHDGWWVRDLCPGIHSQYIISLSTYLTKEGIRSSQSDLIRPGLSDYDVFATYTYRNFWPFKNEKIYVMKERPESDNRTK